MTTSKGRPLLETFTRGSYSSTIRVSVVRVHATHLQRTNANHVRRFGRYLIARRRQVVKGLQRSAVVLSILEGKSEIRRSDRLVGNRRVKGHTRTLENLCLHKRVVSGGVFIRYRAVGHVGTNRPTYLTSE